MTAIHRFVEACQNGTLPNCVGKVPSGWVIMGAQQVMPGYCLLLPDPVVPHLNGFSGSERNQFLNDMARVGDIVLELTGAVRINYEMLGNLEPALHAHIIPRFDTESADLRTKPIWFYDWEAAPKFDLDRDHQFMSQLRERL